MKTIFAVLLSISITPLFSQVSDTIDYFGQPSPGNVITKFAPGTISKSGRHENSISFSPDGLEVFLCIYESEGEKIVAEHANYSDNVWQSFEKFDSIGDFTNAENAVLGPIPGLLYFWNGDIGISTKKDSIWSKPFITDIQGAFCTFTKDSVLYYRNDIGNDNALRYSKLKNMNHEEQIALPYPINFNNSIFNPNDPCISPDGSYLLLRNDGGSMGTGLYISFKKNNNQWTNPKKILGINGSGSQYLQNPSSVTYFAQAPIISPDGKYLFGWAINGDEVDIYWVSTDFVEEARNTNFIPYVKEPISDITDSVGNSFNYTLPDSMFIDDDGNETLTITVTEYGKNELPGWLDYDPETRTISGNLTETGTFSIKVTATDTAEAAVSDVFKITVEDLTAIRNPLVSEIKIYPNPTNGILHIENVNSFTNISFEVYSLTGQLLQTDVLTGNAIDLTSFEKGFYILKLNMEEQTYNERILIE